MIDLEVGGRAARLGAPASAHRGPARL